MSNAPTPGSKTMPPIQTDNNAGQGSAYKGPAAYKSNGAQPCWTPKASLPGQ